MIGLIIVSIILSVITYTLQGLNLWSIMATVSTILFCARKVGYFARLEVIMGVEIAGAFLTVVLQFLLKRFDLLEFLIIVLIRLVYLAIVAYDSKIFVYVTVEKKRDTEED